MILVQETLTLMEGKFGNVYVILGKKTTLRGKEIDDRIYDTLINIKSEVKETSKFIWINGTNNNIVCID